MPTKSKKKVSIEVEKNEAPEEENLASMTEEEEVKVTIEDLPGVGPATAAVSYTHLTLPTIVGV